MQRGTKNGRGFFSSRHFGGRGRRKGDEKYDMRRERQSEAGETGERKRENRVGKREEEAGKRAEKEMKRKREGVGKREKRGGRDEKTVCLTGLREF